MLFNACRVNYAKPVNLQAPLYEKSSMQTAQAMQERRDSIIAAAQVLLAQEDLSAFSLRKLATSAGVSVATIYNLIGNRQAVLFAIVKDLTEKMRYTREGIEETSVLDHVERRLTALISFTRSREELLRSANLAFDQLSRDADWSQSTSRIINAAESMYIDAFERGVDAGELRGDVSARVLSGLVYRVYLNATMNWAYRRISMNKYKKTVLRDGLIVLLADSSDSFRSQVLERLSIYHT